MALKDDLYKRTKKQQRPDFCADGMCGNFFFEFYIADNIGQRFSTKQDNELCCV